MSEAKHNYHVTKAYQHAIKLRYEDIMYNRVPHNIGMCMIKDLETMIEMDCLSSTRNQAK